MEFLTTERVQEAAYKFGYERGLRCFDSQYLWGGRVTRRGEAEAAARAFLRAREEGDDTYGYMEGQPVAFTDDMEPLDKVRRYFGSDFVLTWQADHMLTESEAAALVAMEYAIGYEGGLMHGLEDDARSFLSPQP
jgi:hypothetical protein